MEIDGNWRVFQGRVFYGKKGESFSGEDSRENFLKLYMCFCHFRVYFDSAFYIGTLLDFAYETPPTSGD